MNLPMVALDARAPVWSGALTTPLARRIRPQWRPAALAGIRACHTAIFASLAAAILLVVWDGLWQRPTARTVVAGAVFLAESAIFVSNNQVCPLTPLAEQVGANRGSVADIFLPDWFSRRIPVIGGTALVVGLALNGRVWLRRWMRTRRDGCLPWDGRNGE
ncbi:MAG: hypothetical protein ABIZ57_05515 [Candidatus Limnocylindria bacterium]